jgi:hypothetical protein
MGMTGSRLVAALLVITWVGQSTRLAAGPSSNNQSWERVRKMKAGDQLRIHGYGTRFFVAADDSTLYVINADQPQVPWQVNAALKELIRSSPNSLLALHRGSSVNGLSHHIRLERGGVFVADQRVADLDTVYETIPRATLRADAIEKPRHLRAAIITAASITGGVLLWWGLTLNSQ